MAIMSGRYVKFYRGTPKAWDLLTNKDSDTLYFIAETDALTGKLYLGDQLISGSAEAENIPGTLADLTDVDLTGLGDKKILSYDANSEKWIPLDIDVLVSGGLTADDVDGTTITINEDGKLTANLITYTIESGRNLEDTGITITLKGSDNSTSSIIIDDVDLSNYYTKAETDKAIADAVSKVSRLQRKVVANLEEAQTFVNNNKDTADQYIFMVPNEDGGYDEYMYFPEKDALEKVGSWGGADLNQYVTEEELEAALFIKSVEDTQFTVDDAGKLSLKPVSVDIIQGLDTWIIEHRDSIAGLYPVDDQNKLQEIEEGAQVNFINSVNDAEFTVTNGKLDLKAVTADKITGLENKFVLLNNFNTVVGNLDEMLANRTTTMDQDIALLNEHLTWHSLD